jgi:hypothetical protein
VEEIIIFLTIATEKKMIFKCSSLTSQQAHHPRKEKKRKAVRRRFSRKRISSTQ